jgi:hypothetical protein
MSLEGSFETVALPEVLSLLAMTAKTGALEVNGDRAQGRLWFDDGQLSGFEVGNAASAVDALFDLVRVSSGTFAFVTGAQSPSSQEPQPIDGPLGQAQERLAVWDEVVAVVPSLRCQVTLADRDRNDSVVLDPGQWRLVRSIGDGRSVAEVLARVGLGEFEGCSAIKTLVEEGLTDVGAELPDREPPVVEESVDDPSDIEEETDQPDESGAGSLRGLFAAADLGAATPEAADEPPSSGSWFDEVTLGSAAEAHSGDDPADDAPPPAVTAAGEIDPGALVFGESGYGESGFGESGSDDGAGSTGRDLGEVGADWAGEVFDQESEADDPPAEDLAQVPYVSAMVAESAAAENSAQAVGAESSPTHGYGDAVEGEARVDGLVDRGPWTEGELADLNAQKADWLGVLNGASEGPETGEPAATADAGAEGVDGSDAAEEAEEAEPEPEPINRGLLIKFLSSVRQ